MVKQRKLKMELRETRKKRSISFTKRRQGLFNKAANLSVITDAWIALWVTSPSARGKTYSFTSHHSIDAILNLFLQGIVPEPINAAMKNSAMSLWQEINMLETNNLRPQKVGNRDKVGAAQGCLDEFENCNSFEVLKDIVDRLESMRNELITRMNKPISQVLPLNSYPEALPLNSYPANYDSDGFLFRSEDNDGGGFNNNPNVGFGQIQNQEFFHDQCDEKQLFEEFDSVLESLKKDDGGGVTSSNMNQSLWNWGIGNDASLWRDLTGSGNLPAVAFDEPFSLWG